MNWQGDETISDATVIFQPLIEHRAVDAVHPDIETSGGRLLETKRIADYAELSGLQVAMYQAGSRIGPFAVS